MLRWLVIFCFFAFGAMAQSRLVTDRSENDVALSITFDGAEILVYGALEPRTQYRSDIIVSIEGPPQSVSVLKKGERYGMWLNEGKVPFRTNPSFLAIAASRPVGEILSPVEIQRYGIGIDQAVALRGIPADVTNPEQYAEALVQLRTERGDYVDHETGVTISGEILFSTRVPLSANLIDGDYALNIYLVENKKVVAWEQTSLPVFKTGIERWLFDLSENHGLLYGLLAIAVAIGVALISSQIVQFLKR